MKSGKSGKWNVAFVGERIGGGAKGVQVVHEDRRVSRSFAGSLSSCGSEGSGLIGVDEGREDLDFFDVERGSAMDLDLLSSSSL